MININDIKSLPTSKNKEKKKRSDTEIAIAFYTWRHCTRKGANVW